MNYYSLLNTFFGAGISSALIYILVLDVSPLIAAIVWTVPFTMIFPIINFHKNNLSNKFIGTYLKTQTKTMVLLLVFLFANAHFIENAKAKDGIYLPMLKGTGLWFISAIIYYFIFTNINSKTK